MADQMLPITGFENGGVILDTDPFAINLNQWSDCRNVRFDNGSVSKITGERQATTLSATPNGELIYWQQPGSSPDKWMYVDTNGILREKVLGVATDEAFNTTALSRTNRIDLNLFNGGATLIVNDGSGAPYFVHSADVAGAASSQSLQRNSSGWVRTGFSGTSASVVRPFRNVLMAGNLVFTNASGAIYAQSTLRVSNLAARGAIPNWDANYAGATTGDEFDLATNSPIIDMIPFQDAMAVYTTDSIWLVRLTGNTTLPVSVTAGSQGRGMLAKNCGVEYYGRHFIVGSEDIYVYGGGAQVTSVADSKIRDYFFDGINRSQISKTTVVHNRLQSEIWIGYVKGASTNINEILIYNYDHKTWSIRDADSVPGMAVGAPVSGSVYDNTRSKVMMPSASPNELLETDIGNSFKGSAINAYVERKGLDIAPTATQVKKWVDSTYYIIRGTGNVTVQARATDTPGRPADFTSTTDRWLKNRTFSLDPDMGDYKVDFRDAGRYWNTRIGSNDATSSWDLVRYNLAFSTDDER